MTKKKTVAKKSLPKKTLLQKAGNIVSHLKDDIAAGKDHVVEFAGDAFDSIKKGVKHLVETGKPKKAAKKKPAKKIALKKTAKKASPKRIARKTVKKAAKKK